MTNSYKQGGLGNQSDGRDERLTGSQTEGRGGILVLDG
jgi:hypothetical protein